MGDWVDESIFLHGPHFSDLLVGTTEAHGSEHSNRDDDSRPLSLLNSKGDKLNSSLSLYLLV